jgi:3-dehydroquinate dehydratase/shikimate dehydrogenase
MTFCIPICADTTEAALGQMEKSAPLADILELRIDRIRDLDLKKLMNEKQTKIVITNRRKDEGGEFSGSEQERVELLKEAVALGADYVDIEAVTERHLIKELVAEITRHHNRTKWIISSHDFSGTPPEGALRKRFNAYSKADADIVKLCTYAHAMEDNLRVLGLIPYARSKGHAIIALCMGGQGRISRVVGPLLGASWGYVSLEKGAESAPGQLTIEEMRLIYQILHETGTEE